ncbi:MAG: DUF262 domain-containing protein [Hormoscilla sp. GM7CHS1pb]|nr:DUF262 domain-containing protein [Hormoscilla sp. GM7CHS1pb]
MTDTNNPNSEFIDDDIDIYEDPWNDEEEEIIIESFDPALIKVDTRPMTIDLVLSRIEYEELDLAPDFQRQAGIWTQAAKSRLIESILIRIPLPAFYMDATNEDKWLVIDGLQRLTAIKQFVIDGELKLKGLEFLAPLEGASYKELPRNYKRRIQETLLTVYLIEKGTPAEVKFTIFRRINRGGLPLSPQELRHALNPGKAPKLLARLADSLEFKDATGIRDWRKKRMVDHEFALRFLAFNITNYNNYTSKSLDVFLNQTMADINKMADAEIELLEAKFKWAMVAAFQLFGKSGFRKREKANPEKRYSLNKALFEAWSFNLGQLDEKQMETLKERKSDLNDKFIDMMENDEEFKSSISQGTSTVSKVKYRFSAIADIILELLS